MSGLLVPDDLTNIQIRSIHDLASLYQSRLQDASLASASCCELMLMTETYQKQAFDLVGELIGNLAECHRVLDIGCGYACLLAYLRAHGFSGEYVGIDLVSGFIDKARERFGPDGAARFVFGDFIAMPEADLGRQDYCIATSIFGYVPDDGFIREVIGKACRLAEKGVVFTCNSASHQVLPLKAKTYRPADILSMCLEYGKSIDLKHRCLPVDDSHYAMIGAMIRP